MERFESLRPSGFAPAFGRVVRRFQRRARRGAEAPLYLRSKGKSNSNSKSKSKSNSNGKSNSNSKCRSFDFALCAPLRMTILLAGLFRYWL